MSAAREAILKAPQKYEPCEVFGGKYSIRVLTGRERDILTAASKAEKNLRETFVALFLGDDEGRRVFDPEKDVDVIANLDGVELDRVISAGLKLNHFNKEAAEDAKKA